MRQPCEGLTKTYNRFHDPNERDPDLLKLRDLHAAMDRAVLDVYGWIDVPSDCALLLDYEIDEEEHGNKKKPWRYRWRAAVRDVILARLLELNAERAREEVRSGVGTLGGEQREWRRSQRARAPFRWNRRYTRTLTSRRTSVNNVRVFYSWQSDLPARTTRSFIEKALEKARKEVEGRLNVNLVPDQDLREASGSPNIPETIRAKIRASTVFVADLSIVTQREKGGGQPNACVGVEWGWAEEALGGSALIGTMNTAYGGPDMLPVDIRQNLVRVIYEAAEDCSTDVIKERRQQVTKRLAKQMEASIRARFFNGFHAAAPRFVKALMDRSLDAMIVDESLGPADIARAAGLEEDEIMAVMGDVKAVMADLLRTRLANRGGGAGSGSMIKLDPRFYMHFDPLFTDWNADFDAVDLAKALVKQGDAHITVLNAEFDWSPRRMNPAILRLVGSGLADCSDMSSGSSSPFAREYLRINDETQALAEGRIELPELEVGARSRM